jgi:hypothetical protein
MQTEKNRKRERAGGRESGMEIKQGRRDKEQHGWRGRRREGGDKSTRCRWKLPIREQYKHAGEQIDQTGERPGNTVRECYKKKR